MPGVTGIPVVEIAGVRFCPVPAGRFLRGGPSMPDESPETTIRLRGFAIGEGPTTSAQYGQFVDATGHRRPPLADDPEFGAADHPVVGVSWADAMAYCGWLGEVSGHVITLPTEAQWERAARGDDGRTYPWGDGPPTRPMVNAGGFRGGTNPVGSLAVRSPFGLLDCLGNVWEWCADWYQPDYYRHAPTEDPTGPDHGVDRVARGGSWRSDPFRATCAHRCFMHPSVRSDRHGFRVVVADPPGPFAPTSDRGL